MLSRSSKVRAAFIGIADAPVSLAVRRVCSETLDLVRVVHSARVPKLSAEHSTEGLTAALTGDSPWYGSPEPLESALRADRVELLIVAGCHHRLTEEILSVPTLGSFNVHPSLLPLYRGSNPIFWQYRQGDLTGGVTVHTMDLGFDTGAAVQRGSFEIVAGTPMAEVLPHYAALASRLATRTLQDLLADRLSFEPQGHRRCPLVARRPRAADYLVGWQDWSLLRIWHFLRMGPFIPDAALPAARKLSPGENLQASDSTAPEFPAHAGPFAWEVGEMVYSPSDRPPGLIRREGEQYRLHHPEGFIRLRLAERGG